MKDAATTRSWLNQDGDIGKSGIAYHINPQSSDTQNTMYLGDSFTTRDALVTTDR